MSLSKFLLKDKLLYWIIILLGFQQFPIIRAGGSLKTYEILGFILMISNFIGFQVNKNTTRIEFLSFLFFVIVPLGSYIYTSIAYEYPSNYYATFPKSNNNFKTNYFVFPLFQIFYMVMNWNVFVGFINSRAIYDNLQKIMKVAIILGTVISLYSLCALYVIDFIPLLPSWIQFKFTKEGNRSTGLSQEPGTYVLYQMWICLFIWYSKKSFTKKWWYAIFFINVVSCLLTQSTALWGFVIAILLSFLIFNSTKSRRANSFFSIIIIIIVGYSVIQSTGYGDKFYFSFVKKVTSFFTESANHKALDSGAIRKYTADIGYKIFENYRLFGVGYGRSSYYMYLYKGQVGISFSSERITSTTTPLSMFSILAAEMGIIGLLAFWVFYLSVFSIFWKNRNKSPLHKMFLIGYIAEIGTLFSLYTPHAVFLWAYLGLGLGYVKYFNKRTITTKNSGILYEEAAS